MLPSRGTKEGVQTRMWAEGCPFFTMAWCFVGHFSGTGKLESLALVSWWKLLSVNSRKTQKLCHLNEGLWYQKAIIAMETV